MTATVRTVLLNDTIVETDHVLDLDDITPEKARLSPEYGNLALVQRLYDRADLSGVSESVKGSMFGGLVPGGEAFNGKAEFLRILWSVPTYLGVRKFEPSNWRAAGDEVLFDARWSLTWKATGRPLEIKAVVRTLVRNGRIVETYHNHAS